MSKLESLKRVLQAAPELELAVLVGSQASGTASSLSDWDIAVRWRRGVDGLERLGHTEILRRQISSATGIHPDQIDLIDMASARLAMRAVAAEEGIVLKGEDTLAWSHCLIQIWGELEDYDWRERHAA
jgi:predicted nucleotidyltransferase